MSDQSLGKILFVKQNAYLQNQEGEEAGGIVSISPHHTRYITFPATLRFQNGPIKYTIEMDEDGINYSNKHIRIIQPNNSKVNQATYESTHLSNAAFRYNAMIYCKPEEKFSLDSVVNMVFDQLSNLENHRPSEYPQQRESMDNKVYSLMTSKDKYELNTAEEDMYVSGELHGQDIDWVKDYLAPNFGDSEPFTIESFNSSEELFASLHNGYIDEKLDDSYNLLFIKVQNFKPTSIVDSDLVDSESASFDFDKNEFTACTDVYKRKNFKEIHLNPMTPFERHIIKGKGDLIANHNGKKIFFKDQDINISVSFVPMTN